MQIVSRHFTETQIMTPKQISLTEASPWYRPHLILTCATDFELTVRVVFPDGVLDEASQCSVDLLHPSKLSSFQVTSIQYPSES